MEKVRRGHALADLLLSLSPRGPLYSPIRSLTALLQRLSRSFTDKVRSKRKGSALTGGLLGTATFLVMYLSAMSADGY